MQEIISNTFNGTTDLSEYVETNSNEPEVNLKFNSFLCKYLNMFYKFGAI